MSLITNNPNCVKCGLLNNAGYCRLTACIYPREIRYECYINKPITNADRIRAMTDEELAEWLGDMIYPECPCCPADDRGWCKDCHGRWLSWLKQEIDKEGE